MKQDYYDEAKAETIKGITNGSKQFMETLIKLQTNQDSFGLNQTMLQFKEYVEKIAQTLSPQVDGDDKPLTNITPEQ